MLQPWNWLRVTVIGEKVNMGAVNLTSTGVATVTVVTNLEPYLHLEPRDPYEYTKVGTVTNRTVIPIKSILLTKGG